MCAYLYIQRQAVFIIVTLHNGSPDVCNTKFGSKSIFYNRMFRLTVRQVTLAVILIEDSFKIINH